MRLVNKGFPIAAPFEVGDAGGERGLTGCFIKRRFAQVFAVTRKNTDVPGDAEIVIALPAARIGNFRRRITKSTFAENDVLLGVGARAGALQISMRG